LASPEIIIDLYLLFVCQSSHSPSIGFEDTCSRSQVRPRRLVCVSVPLQIAYYWSITRDVLLKICSSAHLKGLIRCRQELMQRRCHLSVKRWWQTWVRAACSWSTLRRYVCNGWVIYLKFGKSGSAAAEGKSRNAIVSW